MFYYFHLRIWSLGCVTSRDISTVFLLIVTQWCCLFSHFWTELKLFIFITLWTPLNSFSCIQTDIWGFIWFVLRLVCYWVWCVWIWSDLNDAVNLFPHRDHTVSAVLYGECQKPDAEGAVGDLMFLWVFKYFIQTHISFWLQTSQWK